MKQKWKKKLKHIYNSGIRSSRFCLKWQQTLENSRSFIHWIFIFLNVKNKKLKSTDITKKLQWWVWVLSGKSQECLKQFISKFRYFNHGEDKIYLWFWRGKFGIVDFEFEFTVWCLNSGGICNSFFSVVFFSLDRFECQKSSFFYGWCLNSNCIKNFQRNLFTHVERREKKTMTIITNRWKKNKLCGTWKQ